MQLLNIGCGGWRLPSPFINIDQTGTQTPHDTFIQADIKLPLPFEDNSIDGILASHIFEHFDCIEARDVMRNCLKVLVPNGIMVASVPNISYFRSVHHEDTKENSGRLFDEQMNRGNPNKSFFDCVIFMKECEEDYHKQILNEDSLWAIFRGAGFSHSKISNNKPTHSQTPHCQTAQK